jgi:hypothetical protein
MNIRTNKNENDNKSSKQNNTRRKNKNNEDVINLTLMKIISFEYCALVKQHGKHDPKIQELFDEAYDLAHAGESNEKIASVLRQILDSVKRMDSCKDHKSEEEEDRDGSG